MLDELISIIKNNNKNNITTIINVDNILFQNHVPDWIDSGKNKNVLDDDTESFLKFLKDENTKIVFIYHQDDEDFILDYIINNEIDDKVITLTFTSAHGLVSSITQYIKFDQIQKSDLHGLEYFYIDCQQKNIFAVANALKNFKFHLYSGINTNHNTYEKYTNIQRISQGTYGNIYQAKKKDKYVILKEYKSYHKDSMGHDAIVEYNASGAILLNKIPHVTHYKRLFMVGENALIGEIEYHTCDLHFYSKYCTSDVKQKNFAKLVKQLLIGLYYLHENGYVHRDIKLNNILVDIKKTNINFYYTDFGSSYPIFLFNKTDKICRPAAHSKYLPPEIKTNFSERAYYDVNFIKKMDIYGLGVVFSEYSNNFTPKDTNYKTLILNMMSNETSSITELLKIVDIEIPNIKIPIKRTLKHKKFNINYYYHAIFWMIEVLKQQKTDINVFLMSWNILNNYLKKSIKIDKVETICAIIHIASSLHCNVNNYIKLSKLNIISSGACDNTRTMGIIVDIMNMLDYSLLDTSISIFSDYFRDYDDIYNFFVFFHKTMVNLPELSYDKIIDMYQR